MQTFAVFLIHAERRKGVQASGVLFGYWLLCSLLPATSATQQASQGVSGAWATWGNPLAPSGLQSHSPSSAFHTQVVFYTETDTHSYLHRSTHTCCHPAVAAPSSAHTGMGTNTPHSHSAHALPGRRHTVGLRGQNSRVTFQAGFVPKGKGREERDRQKRQVVLEWSLTVLRSKGTYLRRLSWSLQGLQIFPPKS